MKKNKVKKWLIFLGLCILLDSAFIIPMTFFIEKPLSVFLSMIWGWIIGITLNPILQDDPETTIQLNLDLTDFIEKNKNNKNEEK